ncbi:muscle, skeletal receptor tyrosine protein kinase-like isoform X1 [Apostichopus japonicus]|uniref:muscle, skeletal receptor tyrosine protein kinase-like isoform X1 n=1 Tax=Stichopus japonicus TaxID=307972 RepID=UPI003AB1BFC5
MGKTWKILSRQKSHIEKCRSKRSTPFLHWNFLWVLTFLSLHLFLCVNAEEQVGEDTATQETINTIVIDFAGLRGNFATTDLPQEAVSPQKPKVPESQQEPILPQVLPEETSTTSPAVYQALPEIIRSPENLTVSIGSRVTLRCMATDSDQEILITWYKGDVELHQNSSSRISLKGQRLQVTDIRWEDRGIYSCEASNKDGLSVRSFPGRLNVEKSVVILKGIQNQTVTRETVVNSTCQIEGYPEPDIFWEVNKIPYQDPVTNKLYNRQYFLYRAQRTIKLTCKAFNNVSTVGVRRRQSSGVIYVTNPLSYCKDYNGYNCQSYGFGQVFINGSLDNPTGSLERMVTSFLADMDKLKIPSHCKTAFRSLLCHSVFPACDRRDPENLKPTTVCNEDCLATQHLVCLDHWKEIQAIKSPLLELYRSFPNCSADPFTIQDTFCTRTGYFDDMTLHPRTVNCMTGNGHTYEGQQNITENGSYCQNWNQELYQKVGYTQTVFLELQSSRNHCRNPGGLESRPWCFVRKGTMEKQYCDIPTCGPVPVVTTTNSRAPPMVSWRALDGNGFTNNRPESPNEVAPVNSLEISGYLFIIFAALLVLLVMVAAAPIAIRKYRSLTRYPPYSFPKSFDFRKVPHNPMFGKNFNRSFNPLLESLEYPRNDIVFVADIGEGAFGRVFKATAADPSTADQRMVVAVKMLKTSASSGVAENFNREAVLMSQFNNINVIKLWGVCFVGRPLCLLLEFMEKGDLQEFLQMKNPRNPEYFDKEESETGLPRKLHISFARQVANGMVYLSDKRLVHRDVATRNCLVNALMQVKISDFGMARYLEDEDYFIGSKDERLPVRWTAPESLWYYKFTVLSDVWSFGVLIWELFSYAEQPYVGMNLEQVFLQTQQGHQLPCPEETPAPIYNIMKSCWQLDETQRPSFQTLNSQLTLLETGLHRVTRLSSSSA